MNHHLWLYGLFIWGKFKQEQGIDCRFRNNWTPMCCLGPDFRASYIALSEINPVRREKALAYGDVDEVFDAGDPKLQRKLLKLTDGGFDKTLECTRTGSGCPSSLWCHWIWRHSGVGWCELRLRSHSYDESKYAGDSN